MAKMVKGLTKEIVIDNGNVDLGIDMYNKFLPKGVSSEQAEEVNGYNASYAAASMEALKEAAVTHFEDKDNSGLTANFAMGGGLTTSHSITRNDPDESEDPFDAWSSMNMNFGGETSEIAKSHAVVLGALVPTQN